MIDYLLQLEGKETNLLLNGGMVFTIYKNSTLSDLKCDDGKYILVITTTTNNQKSIKNIPIDNIVAWETIIANK